VVGVGDRTGLELLMQKLRLARGGPAAAGRRRWVGMALRSALRMATPTFPGARLASNRGIYII
jgi:hypothetical protein